MAGAFKDLFESSDHLPLCLAGFQRVGDLAFESLEHIRFVNAGHFKRAGLCRAGELIELFRFDHALAFEIIDRFFWRNIQTQLNVQIVVADLSDHRIPVAGGESCFSYLGLEFRPRIIDRQ